MIKTIILSLASLLIIGCASSTEENNSYEILPASKVKWEKLNPLRGDKSPQAGTLWGDIKNNQVPTGFLAKFVNGFSSPPHIHNATYRAVVINGLIHNDDPSAAKMWMPTGSFWTQPKGETHITAAKGDDCVALVEIDKGPYLVLPEKDKFDSGERPINITPNNVVWISNEFPNNKTETAYLWGDIENENGTFLKLPAKFNGKIHSSSDIFRCVVISGKLVHDKSEELLTPGSYFGSKGNSIHKVSTTQETILYIRTQGKYNIK